MEGASGWLERNLTAPPASPRAVVHEAYRQGVIADEARWLALLLDRNLASYTYREATARDVFARLPDHAKLLHALLVTLRTPEATAGPP